MRHSLARDGILTLLGAGASAEAGYPTADKLLSFFRQRLEEIQREEIEKSENLKRWKEEEERRKASDPPGKGTINLYVGKDDVLLTADWFKRVWENFEESSRAFNALVLPRLSSNGLPDNPSPAVFTSRGVLTFPPYSLPLESTSEQRRLYLEDFFAFYDDPAGQVYLWNQIDLGSKLDIQHRFRLLRQHAIQTVYSTLAGYEKDSCDYLAPLLHLPGPQGHSSVIASLNYDTALECLAYSLDTPLWDGFSTDKGGHGNGPPDWGEGQIETAVALWSAVVQNSYEFIGFENAPPASHTLLKLHGSLGWYTLEEGNGDIGARPEFRYNTVYRYCRLSYPFFWEANPEYSIDQLALMKPNNPLTSTPMGHLSPKAGAIWLRPYLVFARSQKLHPDVLSLKLMYHFAQFLNSARIILVIGYSWSDSHINDLILHAVATGATLVNVSQSARPNQLLSLLLYRFPTTYQHVRKRVFVFGGGAKTVLQKGLVLLPTGVSVNFDLASALTTLLPAEFSLECTLR